MPLVPGRPDASARPDVRRRLGAGLSAAAVTLVLAGGTILAGAPAAGAASAAPGWRLTFSDDFSSGSLGSSWFTYGSPYSAGTSYFRPDDVSVSGGHLDLRIERRDYGGMPYTSGGAGLTTPQVYGRYEFVAKPPPGRGIDSYITLWPQDSDDDRDSTLVELLAIPGDENAYLTNGYGGGKEEKTVPGSYAGAFHDYVIEWTPSYLSIAVDGQVIMRSSRVPTARRFLAFAVSNGDNLTGTPDASTSLPADFLVDNVREWAWAPGAGGIPATPTTPTATAGATASTTPTPTPTPSGTPTPTVSGPATPPTRPSGSPVTLRQVADVSSGGGSPPLLPILGASAGGLAVLGLAGWGWRRRTGGPVGRHR